MSKARLVITAVTVEKRRVSEVARSYGVARSWVCTLLARYEAEGEAAFEPRSRRPRNSPGVTAPGTVELIIRLRKELAGSCSWSRTCTSASSTQAPASSSANLSSTRARATRPRVADQAGQRKTPRTLRRLAVSSMSCDITWGGRWCPASGHANGVSQDIGIPVWLQAGVPVAACLRT